MLIEIRTSHFEGTHTSYSWQPYEVTMLAGSKSFLCIQSTRMIEGRKYFKVETGSFFYKIRPDQVRKVIK